MQRSLNEERRWSVPRRRQELWVIVLAKKDRVDAPVQKVSGLNLYLLALLGLQRAHNLIQRIDAADSDFRRDGPLASAETGCGDRVFQSRKRVGAHRSPPSRL
jgi:hypothetical protein